MNISQINDSRVKTRNTIRNVGFGIFDKIVNVVMPFVVRTIILKQMGTEYVGLGSLFTSVLQVLSVAELGVSSAINFCLYKPISEGDENEIKDIMLLYKTIYMIVGVIILFIGISLCPIIPYCVKGSVPSDINLFVLYFIYLFNTFSSYFLFGYKHSIFIAYQRNDILNKVDLSICIIRSILQIIILKVSCNYYLYIVLLPIFTIVSNCIINYLSFKVYPEIAEIKGYSLRGIKNISKQLEGVAIGKISLTCRNSFDSIIISSFLGLTATAIYSNYYYVISSLGSLLSVFLVSMCASVGNSLITKSKESNQSSHLQYDFYFQFIVTWCLMVLLGLFQDFMKLWAGEHLLVSRNTLILFCIYFYVNNMAQVRSVYSEAAGIWWRFRLLTIGEVFLNLILNFLLGFYWGMNGILTATIFTAFMFSFIGITLVTYNVLFGCSSKTYFLNNLFYIITSILGCYLINKIAAFMICDRLKDLLIKGGILGVISLMYLLLIYFCIRRTRTYLLWIREILFSIL